MKVHFIPNETFKDASVAFSDLNEANFPVANLPSEYEAEIYNKLYTFTSESRHEQRKDGFEVVTWTQ
jgi:hypothetical protein